MRNFFYAMVSVSLLAFSLFSVVKSNAQEANSFQLTAVSFPYQIIENRADGQNQAVVGQSGNIVAEKIITDLNLPYYPEDKIKIFPDPALGIGATITLDRAPVYFLKDGKRSKEYRSWTKTVAELFEEKNIELGADDKVIPSLESQIFNSSQIAITRVAITTVVEPKPMDFSVVIKKNNTQEKDYKKILQPGIKGIKNYFYLVRREDGEEISRSFLKTEVTTPPIDQIVEVGTIIKVYKTGIASIWKSSAEMIGACNYVSRGTKVNVVNTDNGKSVVVTCMGGGMRDDRVIDLSDSAFIALGGSWSQGLLNHIRVEKYYP